MFELMSTGAGIDTRDQQLSSERLRQRSTGGTHVDGVGQFSTRFRFVDPL